MIGFVSSAQDYKGLIKAKFSITINDSPSPIHLQKQTVTSTFNILSPLRAIIQNTSDKNVVEVVLEWDMEYYTHRDNIKCVCVCVCARALLLGRKTSGTHSTGLVHLLRPVTLCSEHLIFIGKCQISNPLNMLL